MWVVRVRRSAGFTGSTLQVGCISVVIQRRTARTWMRMMIIGVPTFIISRIYLVLLARWKNRDRPRQQRPHRTCGRRYWTRCPRRARYLRNKSSFLARPPLANPSSPPHSSRNPSPQTTATTHRAQISHSDMTGRTSETRGTKVCLSCAQLAFACRWRADVSIGRYVGAAVRVHGAFACERLCVPFASLLTREDGAATYARHDRVGLDASVDVRRGFADVAQVGGAVGKRGRLTGGRNCERGEPRTTCVFFLIVLSSGCGTQFWNVA